MKVTSIVFQMVEGKFIDSQFPQSKPAENIKKPVVF